MISVVTHGRNYGRSPTDRRRSADAEFILERYASPTGAATSETFVK